MMVMVAMVVVLLCYASHAAAADNNNNHPDYNPGFTACIIRCSKLCGSNVNCRRDCDGDCGDPGRSLKLKKDHDNVDIKN
uniref:Thionin-like cystein-rich peptide n=1 Tax=Torenia fournieri TaxID=68875 RepID=C0A021_9LAMI|nr:thionin-like cystein-rich peptide [Torenia fournieri]